LANMGGRPSSLCQRGTGFPRLPSAVTNTVDHPLRSASLHNSCGNKSEEESSILRRERSDSFR
jgi:hypothetical protein